MESFNNLFHKDIGNHPNIFLFMRQLKFSSSIVEKDFLSTEANGETRKTSRLSAYQKHRNVVIKDAQEKLRDDKKYDVKKFLQFLTSHRGIYNKVNFSKYFIRRSILTFNAYHFS